MKRILFLLFYFLFFYGAVVFAKHDKPIANISLDDIQTNTHRTFYYSSPDHIQLTREIYSYLDTVIEFLRARPNCTVRIDAHFDGAASVILNKEKSYDRTVTVSKYLKDHGIPKERIIENCHGSLNRIANTNSPSGRIKNNRLEISIIELE